MNKSASIKELATALAKAQAEMKNPTFDSTNPHFKSKFASLASVREAVLPVLNKYGLSVTQLPKTTADHAGCMNLLMHASGEWIEEDCLLPLDRANAQGAGSAITYARRYSLQAIAGVVADEDDDGNAAVGETKNGLKKASAAPHKPTDGAEERVEPSRRKVIQSLVDAVREYLNRQQDFDAYSLIEQELTDPDERVYLWTFLDSKERRRLKDQAALATKKVPEAMGA